MYEVDVFFTLCLRELKWESKLFRVNVEVSLWHFITLKIYQVGTMKHHHLQILVQIILVQFHMNMIDVLIQVIVATPFHFSKNIAFRILLRSSLVMIVNVT